MSDFTTPEGFERVFRQHYGPLEMRVAATGPGEQLQLRLPDSSVVTLGPTSRLRYSIGRRMRRVELVASRDLS